MQQSLNNIKNFQNRIDAWLTDITSDRKKLVVFSVIINILLFSIVLLSNKSYFSTNDDYRMKLIVSGRYTGTPSPHMVFVNVLIGYLLSGLYMISRSVPWYAIWLLVNIFLPSCYILYFLFSKGRNKIWFTFFLYLCVFLCFTMRNLISPQFTMCAAYMSAAGVLSFYKCFNTGKHEKQSVIAFLPSLFFIACAYLIRDEVFMLLAPVLLFIVVERWILHGTITSNQLKGIGLILITLICSYGIDQTQMLDPGYREYREFTKARSVLYDYYPAPDYAGNEDFYSSIGLTSEDVELLKSRTLDMDNKLTTDIYKQIAEYSKEKYYSPDLRKRVTTAIRDATNFILKNDYLFSLAALFIILYFMVIYPPLKKSKTFQMNIWASLGYILLLPFLLSFRGRLMDRVIESVMIIGLSLLLCCYYSFPSLKLYSIKFTKNWYKMTNNRINMLLNTMIICIMAYSFSVVYLYQKSAADQKAKTIANATARLETLSNYAADNPENFYFYNALDFIGSSQSIFEEESNFLNIESLGNWYMKSPDYYERNAEFDFTSANDALTNSKAYYVELNKWHSPISNYLYKNYQLGLDLIDSVKVDENNKIQIYEINPVEFKKE